MTYLKIISIFLITIAFFSCSSETTKEAEEEKVEVATIINESEPIIKENEYLLTRSLTSDKSEELIAAFELMNKPDNKYYLVNYNSNIHQLNDVLVCKQPLTDDTFDGENYMFVKHLVKDYDEWEKQFLLFESTRTQYTIKVVAILTTRHKPNDVTVVAEFTDLAKVTKYGLMLVGGSIMSNAGVTSKPQILIMTK